MGFFESIASTFGRSFDYEGRSSRSEYWYWVIFTALLGNPLGYFLGYFIVEGELGIIFAIIAFVALSLPLIIPGIALTARRLHDRNLSGWWQLGYLIAFRAMFPVDESLLEMHFKAVNAKAQPGSL
ncbi:MAG: DUF805 domain-containing protein [Gammaproteobacteria bacterium]|jgi:uncharacterized membrane protein YhaH (DUF805 family)|nr:DUF805 domain-containing protein [Gammaproteobacteria bacterium]